MKFYTIAIVPFAFQQAVAHYTFSKIALNGGAVFDNWRYIRKLAPGWAYSPIGQSRDFNPYYDIYDDNIRCGRGAATAGAGVETLSVNGGDIVSFFTTTTEYDGSIRDPTIYHEGPGLAYLSRATGELEKYEGDGDWFKIGEIVKKNVTTWALQGVNHMDFTIPEATPAGKYLLRAENIFPYDSTFNNTQWYVSCAHIEVKTPGEGEPGPMVKFPGAYDLWDRSIWVPYRVGDFKHLNLTDYIPPGPQVWQG